MAAPLPELRRSDAAICSRPLVLDIGHFLERETRWKPPIGPKAMIGTFHGNAKGTLVTRFGSDWFEGTPVAATLWKFMFKRETRP